MCVILFRLETDFYENNRWSCFRFPSAIVRFNLLYLFFRMFISFTHHEDKHRVHNHKLRNLLHIGENLITGSSSFLLSFHVTNAQHTEINIYDHNNWVSNEYFICFCFCFVFFIYLTSNCINFIIFISMFSYH